MAHPPIKKGANPPFRVAIACWIDLLGYGSMIAKADLNPMKDEAKAAISRLRSFHRIIAENSHRNFPTLVMNDGAVSYRDLSLRTRSVTFDFLCRCANLHKSINIEENKRGYPGARMVLATGFRALGRRHGLDNSAGHLESLLKRFKEGKIKAAQAVREAASIRPAFDIMPQLQSNYAFTKAYVAESSGTSGGLSGARLFVEENIFNVTPLWITTDEKIHWKSEKLNIDTSFLPISDIIQSGHPPGGPIEVRTGIEVGRHLSGDPDILNRLIIAE